MEGWNTKKGKPDCQNEKKLEGFFAVFPSIEQIGMTYRLCD
jgi:hypothetical protein